MVLEVCQSKFIKTQSYKISIKDDVDSWNQNKFCDSSRMMPIAETKTNFVSHKLHPSALVFIVTGSVSDEPNTIFSWATFILKTGRKG